MEQKVMWDYYQGEGENSFSGAIPRLNYLVKTANKLLRSQAGLNILNVGVGGGHLEQVAAQNGFIPHSLDPSSVAIEKIQRNGFTGVVGRIESISYESEMFDVVFCSEILEHLQPQSLKIGLREIHRVLKKKRYLIGTVPYSELLEANNVICPHCAKKFHRWGHEQSFNKETMTRILKEEGFVIIKLETHSFVSYKNGDLLSQARAIGSKILGRLGISLANPSLFFLAQKL